MLIYLQEFFARELKMPYRFYLINVHSSLGVRSKQVLLLTLFPRIEGKQKIAQSELSHCYLLIPQESQAF